MESKLIYQKTKSIAEELARIDLLNMFIVPIKEHDTSKIEKIFEQFKTENQDLWERFFEIYNFLNDENEICIFEDLDRFDDDFSDEMCINFSVLLILTKHEMNSLETNIIDETETNCISSLKELIELLTK